MLPIFILGLALNLVAPWSLLRRLQRHWELESSFYGLVAVGAGAAMVAYLGSMGAWVGYQAIAPLPEALPRAELALRVDVLFFTTVLLGLTMELVKCYGVYMFHSRMVRGNLPLFGVAVGIGAGMLQALLVLGATLVTGLTGQEAIGLGAVMLTAEHLGLTFMHAILAALVMYRAAEGHRVQAIIFGGALHGAGLLLAKIVSNSGWLGEMTPVLSGPLYALVGVAGGVILWRWVKTRGWPM